MQINSTDSYGRHRIEGYCFLNIPMKTGSFKFEVPCYKPREDNYMKVFSYFLGGSRKIPDLKEIAKSSSKNENVSEFCYIMDIIHKYLMNNYKLFPFFKKVFRSYSYRK